MPGLDDARVRLLATPVGRTAIVVAGASLEDRDEALAGLRTQLLIGGPLALLLASLAGYAARRRGAAAGRGDAPPRGGDLGAAAGRSGFPSRRRDDEIAGSRER